MDRFITISKQKENDKCIGRTETLKTLRHLIETNSKFCVYGDSGVGKTFVIEKALEGIRYIELHSENFKSDFLCKIRDTDNHVLIDDQEVPHGTFENKLSKGSLIVVSRKIIEGFDCIKIDPLSDDEMIEIGKIHFPDVESLKHIDPKGNIRNFLFTLDNFSHKRDFFKTPKELVYDLVCKNGSEDPKTFLGHSVNEHGYSWGIVHENYLDSINSSQWFEKVADYMSLADLEDVKIYDGNTQTSIFSLYGIILPAIELDHTLDKQTMRPGSAWTKFNNYKMRFSRYQSMTNRKIRSTIDINSLNVISQYCKSDSKKAIETLSHYGLTSADVDVMNHLSIINKIKPRALQLIKKQIKNCE